MSRTTRAIGVCGSPECEEFLKHTFLMNNPGPDYYCTRCRRHGEMVIETNSWSGSGDEWGKSIVEFDWCAAERRYRQTAIVMDTATPPPYRTHKLNSPLIKTEKRALKVAEQILANLRWFEMPVSREVALLMDGDREGYMKRLQVTFAKMKLR